MKFTRNQQLLLDRIGDRWGVWTPWSGYRFYNADGSWLFLDLRGVTRTVESLLKKGALVRDPKTFKVRVAPSTTEVTK